MKGNDQSFSFQNVPNTVLVSPVKEISLLVNKKIKMYYILQTLSSSETVVN
ncbi:hypothetical protein EW15_1306 [Prochlorococcus sp. MIT 0801]|nr:hypothetical protein EW15_1306 [Prochlorococcus sp. MIT 0801]